MKKFKEIRRWDNNEAIISEEEMKKYKDFADAIQNSGKSFFRADLRSANLSSANLSYANLSYANLRSANLRSANLRSANLRSADLSYADLSYADLRSANLRSANLRSANLRSANKKLINSYIAVCPQEGSFIAWKKIENHLIKIEVSKKAKRLNSFGSRKIRVSEAKVISIENIETKKKIKKVIGGYDKNFVYERGKIVIPDKFDNDQTVECSNGIHCFITKEEALRWQ